MLTVYHIKRTSLDAARERGLAFSIKADASLPRAAAAAFAEGMYEPVASIDLLCTMASLEAAYALTQNTDDSWSRSPPLGLRVVRPGHSCRSTMIGDVIEFSDPAKRPRAAARYVVAWTGFDLMPLDAPALTERANPAV